MNLSLREYQREGVDRVRDAFRAGARSVLFVGPTAMGKTVIFCYITESARNLGKRVMILTHRQEIHKQTCEKLREFDVDHGIIVAGKTMTAQPIQVASVQTLARRISAGKFRIPEPDLLIIDECHHAAAKTWQTVLGHFSKARILGVTATPCRLDGKPLKFDTLVQGPTVRELIALDFLSRPRTFAPPSGVVLDNVTIRGGDYAAGELEQAVNKPKITGDAVGHYLRLCPGVPAIAFCVTVAHAEAVAQAFRDAGIRAETVDGTLSDAQRSQRIEGLGNGNIQVLTSCEIISEGTDIPVVTAAIFLRPTNSMGLYLQQVGRAMRVHPGKEYSYILDHVGNAIRHGLPDETRNWSLISNVQEERKKTIEEAKLYTRQCPVCYTVHLRSPECPSCGYVYEAKDRSPQEIAGKLRELKAEEMRQAEEDRRNARRQQGFAQSLDALIKIGREKGYKNPGWWAQKVYAARQAKKGTHA